MLADKRRREDADVLSLMDNSTLDDGTPATLAISSTYCACTKANELAFIASVRATTTFTSSLVHKALPATEVALLLHCKQTVAASSGAYLPASHARQAPPAVPADALYFPARQLLQSPPSSPSYPGAHLHSVRFLLPRADIAFKGHGSQLTAPAVSE